jgi:DNA-directed RNA polymerase
MTKTPLEELTEDLKHRQTYLFSQSGSVDKRKKAWKIANIEALDIIELTYGHVLTGIEKRTSLATVVANIGKSINRKYKLSADPVEEAHIGWFVMLSYFEMNYISYVAKHLKKANGRKSKYPTYQIVVKNVDAINQILTLVNKDKVDLFPNSEPPGDWTEGFTHKKTGYPLIKNAPKETIDLLKYENLDYVKSALNKLNNTGWRINKDVFLVFKKCMYNEKTPFKFHKEIDPVKKASLLIEVNAIVGIAERNLNNAFYHLYNLDFRGRIYPNTAFLHEQSSDNAKGLLLLDQPVLLGEQGTYWLFVHTANVLGQDKLELDERVNYVESIIDDIIGYAEDPLVNTGWMDADKPFSFLAACYEIYKLLGWCNAGYPPEEFPSCLPIYIDGSNNGVQHLVAMSKDHEVAPLVNLVQSKLPGDVYMYIAEHVMEKIEKRSKLLKQEDVDKFEPLFNEYVSLLREIEKWPEKSEKKKLAKAAMLEFKNHNYDLREKLFPIYWNKIKDKKVWRKILKRNVMTLAYGGTRQGMGAQIVDDTRDLSEYLRDKEVKWGYMLGSLAYDTCYERLPGPASMLEMFQSLAIRENKENRHLEYRVPVTNFPFRHNYRKPLAKEISFYYGEERIRVTLSIWQEATLDKNSQKTGAAPNVVHSLDAAHLTSVIHDTDYPVTVVHDSFGCHAGNMDKLFYDVRKKFVELYEQEPLEFIMKQLNSEDLIPKKGLLDVKTVLESDFAFA